MVRLKKLQKFAHNLNMSEKIKKSRKKTRQCLFQALYSCVYLKEAFDLENFLNSFFNEIWHEFLDRQYFEIMFSGIQDKELELIYIIKRFAPKFNITTMPLVNILPIFIASYEQLYLDIDQIPVKVSIDEALELSKIFGDDNWRILVNWVLNSLKDEKEKIGEDIEKNKWTNKIYF